MAAKKNKHPLPLSRKWNFMPGANPPAEAFEMAVENGIVSKKLLIEIARRYGLKETQEAVSDHLGDMERLRDELRAQLKSADKHIDLLFSARTTKALGVELPALGRGASGIRIQAAIARALESGTLAKDRLIELARKFGLDATQEAAATLESALIELARKFGLDERQELLSKRMDVLFRDKTAKALGEWPRPADYYDDPQPRKPRRKAA